MKIALGFGTQTQEIQVPEKNLLAVLEANKVAFALTGEAEVRRALEAPIGSPRLGEIVRPGETVAIVTSDITRPCPTGKILPPLLEELFAAGIRPEDVTVTFALGSHRGHTEEERKKLMGPAWGVVACRDSDPDGCVHLGDTRRGTPVDIDAAVAKADRRILLANIEYHYFAGYSGGAKSLMPGVSTRAAIQANHSRMVEDAACAGRLEGNPVRQDIEEAAALCGADFIVNVVLDAHKEIVRAVAGDMTAAHREGCRFLDTMYRTSIPRRADIVVVSQGGAPKDLNLYQAQKALDNAKHAVRPGGIIVLVGSCREGLGEKTFQEWMLWAKEPDDLIRRVREDFKLGGHKAAAIAMVLKNAEIDLVSDLDPDLVKRIFLHPWPTAQAALDHAFETLGADASVIVMPYGGSTLPCAENE
ncbi:MAG: nickel-dependent lactate racemase [Oscillospiraceae bacterium]|nr:nickel-dependent lactate racemase [Oscillospiraceae bacterium]